MAKKSKSAKTLKKAEEKYQKIVDLSIKDKIYFDIIQKYKESPQGQQESEESISFEAFGKDWTFRDTQAIREAATQPNGFSGIQNREWLAVVQSLTIEEVSSLAENDKLAPESSIVITDDLVPWMASLVQLTPNVNWSTFDRNLGENEKYLYTVEQNDNGDFIGRYLVDPPTGQYLPPSSTAETFNDKFGQSPGGKRVNLNSFTFAIDRLIKQRFPESELLQKRYEELVKDVAEQLKADLAGEQVRRKIENAIAPRDVAPQEDVVKERESPEAPKLTPFDFQCFLLENISKLVDQRETGGSYARKYSNIIPVSTNGDPGNIINTIEHGSRAGVVESFLNICPDVYGLLVPYLKISRLEYDKLGNILVDPKTKRAVVRDLEIPNFISKDDISSILSGGTGRAPGAGIKSFTWSLDGVQPAEVDNNISATLVMYFQSVNDFFNGARSAGQAAPNFLDLIINSPAVKKLQNKKSGNKAPEEKPCSDDLLRTQIHKDYEGKNYRVKICAGWATPDYNTILELVRDDKKALSLIRAINDSRVSLFLQMTQHQINFNQNGSLELTVKYQASLAGLLSGKTANIFDESSGSIDEDIKREKDKIEDIEEREDRGSLSGDKENKKKALEKIKELRNIQRNEKYRKLLRKIYSSGRVYNISLNPNELLRTPYKELTPTQRQERVKRKEETATFEFDSVATVNQELLDALNENIAAKGSDVADAYSSVATKTFDQLQDQTKVNIPFFYLGDLFDTVLDEIKDNNKKNAAEGTKPLNFNFFISDVEMIDPLQAFKLKNLEDLINCGYDLRDIVFLDAAAKETPTDHPEMNGIYRTMNIGDIPISLDAFQLWFKNNVVKKSKNNYFFLYFVKDVCKELITSALSSKCFGKEFNFQQRFDTQPLTLAKQEAKLSNFKPNQPTTSKAIAKAKASVSCNLDPTQTELGLLLYPTDSNPKNLRGFYRPDLHRGIYHHYLGSSCGLVKQINFQREDQPYLRESRIQKEGALGAEQLRELYSANIELVGNTLYKNGMYIYINPSLLGADRAYLDYLGLHGYYMVTKVESTVTPSNFNVSIRALHEGIEFGSNKLLPGSGDVGRFFDPEFPAESATEEVDTSDLEIISKLAAARERGGVQAESREAEKIIVEQIRDEQGAAAASQAAADMRATGFFGSGKI